MNNITKKLNIIAFVLALFPSLIIAQTSGGQITRNTSKKLNYGKGYVRGHEWVDLGLPSGLKWATCNIGASSPDKLGNYYAWGETRVKSSYSDANYLYKDVLNGEYINLGYNISGTEYDAAHVIWGGKWRMPTLEEYQELLNECKLEWTSRKNVIGILMTGVNGNSIFFPAAGFQNGTTIGSVGSFGYYWVSTLSVNYQGNAYHLYFNSQNCTMADWHRCFGLPIRPVIK